MFNDIELERLHSFFTDPDSVWGLILQHMLEIKEIYIGELINSSDTEDEKIKGKIICIQQDIEMMPDYFKNQFKAILDNKKDESQPPK
jgi:hypothetical protein